MDGDLIFFRVCERAPYWGPLTDINEWINHWPWRWSFSLHEDMEEGGHLPGTLMERHRKTREMGISRFRGPLGNLCSYWLSFWRASDRGNSLCGSSVYGSSFSGIWKDMGGGLREWTYHIGFITRKLWEIVVRGLWWRGISLYGSSVKEPGGGAPLLGSLKVMKGRIWGWAFRFMGAQLGNMEWAHLPGTLIYGWKGLCRCGVSLCGSSVKGTWREGFLAGDPEGYAEKALEMGISFHRGPVFGEPGGGLVYWGLWEKDEGALGMRLLSLMRLRGGALGRGAASLGTLEDMFR